MSSSDMTLSKRGASRVGGRSGGSCFWLDPPPGVHAGDQCSRDMCRTECQPEVTAGDHAGDGEYCPGLLSTRGDGVLTILNSIGAGGRDGGA